MRCELLCGACDRPAVLVFSGPYFNQPPKYSCAYCADAMSNEWGKLWKEIKFHEKESNHRRYRTRRVWVTTKVIM